MKILYTIKEYAKIKGLSEIAIRKKVSLNYNKIIKIDKESYIIADDKAMLNLKQNIKNKNSQIRELKLKLSIKSDNKYLQELEKQILELKKRNNKLEKKVDKIQSKKDKLYEKIFATFANQKNIIKG